MTVAVAVLRDSDNEQTVTKQPGHGNDLGSDYGTSTLHFNDAVLATIYQ